MIVLPNEASERIGHEVAAEFEVLRGTDTETVRADPYSVVYGTVSNFNEFGYLSEVLPLIVFEYDKFHSALPPWNDIDTFTLYGEESAIFFGIDHRETQITGDLKTVRLAARHVVFEGSDYKIGE